MRVETIHMTPELAAKMLANNVGNRALRKTTVRAYAADMKAGEWRCTHQPIAQNASGQLVDGQHRLSAVILAQWSGVMQLATYDTDEQALKIPVDRGVMRKAYDVLQQPRDRVECVSRLLKETLIATRTAPVHMIDKILEKHALKIDRIFQIRTSSKKFAGAANAIAALLLTAHADRTSTQTDESLEQYSLFFNQSYSGMWPHVQAFNAWLTTGRGSKTRYSSVAYTDMFMRVYLAFDFNRRNLKTNRIADYQAIRREIVERAKLFIGDCVE